MRKLSLEALVFMLFIPSIGIAADMELTQVVFTNGTYEGAIPASYQPVVQAIKEVLPKATFKAVEGKLQVGVKEVKADFSIVCQSDCPVNSQFRYQKPDDSIVKAIKPTLVAWTKMRHPGFEEASVKDYRQTDVWAEVILNEPKKVARR